MAKWSFAFEQSQPLKIATFGKLTQNSSLNKSLCSRFCTNWLQIQKVKGNGSRSSSLNKTLLYFSCSKWIKSVYECTTLSHILFMWIIEYKNVIVQHNWFNNKALYMSKNANNRSMFAAVTSEAFLPACNCATNACFQCCLQTCYWRWCIFN